MAPEDTNYDNLPPGLVDEIKRQVIAEMQDEKKLQAEEDKIRRVQEKEAHEVYVARMKESPDPWSEVVNWKDVEGGARIELDWNAAFINFLRENGITGADDDQVVQKYLILMMQDVANRQTEENGEYE